MQPSRVDGDGRHRIELGMRRVRSQWVIHHRSSSAETRLVHRLLPWTKYLDLMCRGVQAKGRSLRVGEHGDLGVLVHLHGRHDRLAAQSFGSLQVLG